MVHYTDYLSPDDFLRLAQGVWPGSYGMAEVAAALEKTINIGAWDGERLVGSVRVLTDGYFFATIPEILVLAEYRRKGIGRELLRRAVLVAPRQKLLFWAQPESEAFFERVGCQRSLAGFMASL
jgi:GNAT superfamily N-acetyltransferase